MPSRVRNITFDADDPMVLGRFWAEVTGYELDVESDDEVAFLRSTDGSANILIQPVPEPKTAKNRVHLDLQPDVRRDEEVERLLGIGATVVDDRREPDGSGWVVMADPEGNEFCVERSRAERGED